MKTLITALPTLTLLLGVSAPAHAEYLCPGPNILHYTPAQPTGSAFVPSYYFPDVKGHPYQFAPPSQLAGTPLVHIACVPPLCPLRYPRYGYRPEMTKALYIRAAAEGAYPPRP